MKYVVWSVIVLGLLVILVAIFGVFSPNRSILDSSLKETIGGPTLIEVTK